ncbi:MAG TPA: hypothetical protein VKB56_01730 [Terriglobales bacterium]|nr:hypothetical protein [Terriglobales bacterium]
MKTALRLLVTVAASMALIAPALAADRAQENSAPNTSTAKQDDHKGVHPAKKSPGAHSRTAAVHNKRPTPPAKAHVAQNHAVKPQQKRSMAKATPEGITKGHKTGWKGGSAAPGQAKETAAAPAQQHHRLAPARYHRDGHQDKDKGDHDKK